MRKDLKKKKRKWPRLLYTKRREKHLEHLWEVDGGLWTNLTRTIRSSLQRKETPQSHFQKSTDLISMQYAELCMIFIKQMNLLHSRKSMLPWKVNWTSHMVVKICVKFLLKLDFGTENEAGNEFLWTWRYCQLEGEVFKEDQANPRARARKRHSLFGRNMADGRTSEK